MILAEFGTLTVNDCGLCLSLALGDPDEYGQRDWVDFDPREVRDLRNTLTEWLQAVRRDEI